ncbi:MAG: hypothetical protein CMH57_01335 [Myxococcales bacterium]|nr:hypothetical protein [Myxococcales bacterium]
MTFNSDELPSELAPGSPIDGLTLNPQAGGCACRSAQPSGPPPGSVALTLLACVGLWLRGRRA